MTKKIEVEGDGSKIQEQVRRFQEFKFREFKITKSILEKFGLSDNCKGIRDDEVLRVRLDMRDVRLNRDAGCEKRKRPQELKVDELMGEAEAAGGKVAEDLLVSEDNIVDAETFEEETSDANREDADNERDKGRRKRDSGVDKQAATIAVVGV